MRIHPWCDSPFRSKRMASLLTKSWVTASPKRRRETFQGIPGLGVVLLGTPFWLPLPQQSLCSLCPGRLQLRDLLLRWGCHLGFSFSGRALRKSLVFGTAPFQGLSSAVRRHVILQFLTCWPAMLPVQSRIQGERVAARPVRAAVCAF